MRPNSALLTDAFSSLRCACGAAKRGRYAAEVKGFHDEALAGEWKGHRSSRLGIQYRVIYRTAPEQQLFQVISITTHDYRRP
jgi:hypothetical protein